MTNPLAARIEVAGHGARAAPSRNRLYYGDNLDVMRRYLPTESVDLVYLDPPFNSQQDYNVLFKSKSGHKAAAQIKAFSDTWEWNEESSAQYDQLVTGGNDDVAKAAKALRTLLGTNDLLAYLVMMAPRLVELRRAMKPTASIYLHCDPTASHYLKILMDAIFRPENFRNEIIWKRTSSHNDSRRWAHIHDALLFYAADGFTWNPFFLPHDPDYVKNFYRYKDERGVYRLDHVIRSASMGPRPNLAYEYKGYTPEWGWRVKREKLEVLDKEGRIEFSTTGRPYLKRYLREQEGTPISGLWTDLPPIGPQAEERQGYPTQKPEALLERIIKASSNEGDVVLDPFCGCGTAVVVAQRLHRKWIGIDITHLAIGLIRHRLSGFEPAPEYEIIGEPKTFEDAEKLAEEDKFQFQAWTLGLVNARKIDSSKRGADRGIDGRKTFLERPGASSQTREIIFSVKGGENIDRSMVATLIGDVGREEATFGILISLRKPTKPMVDEALAAGTVTIQEYDGPKKYPRIQCVTISDLLENRMPNLPPYALRGGGDAALKPPPERAIEKRGPKQSQVREYAENKEEGGTED